MSSVPEPAVMRELSWETVGKMLVEGVDWYDSDWHEVGETRVEWMAQGLADRGVRFYMEVGKDG